MCYSINVCTARSEEKPMVNKSGVFVLRSPHFLSPLTEQLLTKAIFLLWSCLVKQLPEVYLGPRGQGDHVPSLGPYCLAPCEPVGVPRFGSWFSLMMIDLLMKATLFLIFRLAIGENTNISIFMMTSNKMGRLTQDVCSGPST